jgi:hypothetical protein
MGNAWLLRTSKFVHAVDAKGQLKTKTGFEEGYGMEN